jgi:hypothetical protein
MLTKINRRSLTVPGKGIKRAASQSAASRRWTSRKYGASRIDLAGVSRIGPILLTMDGKSCVYGYHRILSDLYLVEGLK